MNVRLKQALAGGAVAAALLGGGAAVAYAQSSPTTQPPASTPSQPSQPSAGTGRHHAGDPANCPNMGGGSTSSSDASSY